MTAKVIEQLIPGDYVFSKSQNLAIIITKDYIDGYRYSCAHAAISKFPDNYRIATDKEIEEGKLTAQKFEAHMNEQFSKMFRDEENESDVNELPEAASFLDWCNEPIYRSPRDIGYQTRVKVQYPEYNSYIIIDSKGDNILPQGVFLSSSELYEYWLKHKNE